MSAQLLDFQFETDIHTYEVRGLLDICSGEVLALSVEDWNGNEASDRVLQQVIERIADDSFRCLPAATTRTGYLDEAADAGPFAAQQVNRERIADALLTNNYMGA